MTGAGSGETAKLHRRALHDLLTPLRWPLRVAIGLTVLGAAAAVIPLIGLAELSKLLLTEAPDARRVSNVVVLIVAALCVRLFCVLIAGALTHRADVEVQHNLSLRLAKHLSRVPLGWFITRGPGDIRATLQDDLSALHHFVGHARTEPYAAVTVGLVAIAYMAWCDWRLAIAAVLPLILGLGLFALQFHGTAERMALYQERLRGLNAAATRYVRDIAAIKTFGETGVHYRGSAEAFRTEFEAWIKHKSALSAATDVVLSPVFAVVWVLLLGLCAAQLGWILPQDVLAFVVLAPGLSAPIMALAFSQQAAIESRAAAARIVQTLQTPTLPTPLVALSPAGSDVRFHDVHFGYCSDTSSTLSGVTLTLPQGTTTALVGPSGSGKSTLAKLLPRFWDPIAGRIMIGGVDLKDIDSRVLHRKIGFVFQEAHVLRDTVRANIALGMSMNSDQAVETAAKQACLHAEICALPKGYDTVLGEDASLSGGQAQRLSLARVFLTAPDIVVLDEATAMIDPETDEAVRAAIAAVSHDRTVLTIAHRLSTVRMADQICVLDGGRIVETGTHRSLLQNGGRYTDLFGNADVA